MSIKTFRTGLAAAMGIAVLVAGLIVGATIARADSSDTQQAVPENLSNDGSNLSAHHGFCGDLEEVAAELGIDLSELKQELRDGATLQQLADDAGVDLSTLLENVKQRLRDEVDQKLAEGHITQEQADAIKESIDSFESGDLLTHGFLRRSRDVLGLPFLSRHDWMGDLDLGIDLEELRTKLASGLSLEDALTELGVDVDSLIANARQSALDRVDQMLADGTITEERAAELKQMIENFDLGRVVPFGRDSRLVPRPFDRAGRHGPNGNRFDHQGSDGTTGEGVLLHI